MFKTPAPGTGPGTGATAEIVKDTSDRGFMADVVEPSRTVPVLVDFWAPWCGPCKQIGPMLEKAVRAAKGKVRLVKMNIDENPQIAGRLRIQSIPAVYAFFQGQPIDGFVGAVPESQIRQFIDRVLKAGAGAAPEAGLEDALNQAKQAFDQDDLETAIAIYSEIASAEPDHAGALAGLMRCLLKAGDLDEVRRMLGAITPELAKDKEITAVRTALDLAEQAGKAGPAAELAAAVTRDPDDHASRFDLAMALFAQDRRQDAVDHLIESVRRDRQWNDQQARKQLVKFFEAFGPTDPLTVQGRRRLSSILFS